MLLSTADIRLPLPLKITAISGCVPSGPKQMFNEQKRLPASDVG